MYKSNNFKRQEMLERLDDVINDLQYEIWNSNLN